MNGRDLAQALGVHPSQVARYVRRGMPTDSVEAAKAWRASHVRLRVPLGMHRAAGSAAQLDRLARLWPIGRAALEAGEFDMVAGELRSALAAVPHAARSSVMVDPAVMDALLHAQAGLVMVPSVAREDAPGGRIGADSEDAAAAWYAIAAGEPITRAQLAAITAKPTR